MDSAALAELDHRHLWHPFTQQRDWLDEAPLLIERADRTTLYDTDGNAYIDGVSSLWCNVHGHRHPAIDTAVSAQLERVAHSTLLGLSHPPAVQLAQRLIEVAPPGLSRVFYSDSGSTAVEIALKMAFQWWALRGRDDPAAARKRGFICLRNAYHGDTIGSVSVGGIDLFHSLYRPLLFDAWQAEPGDVGEMEALLAAHGDEVAAVIVEPLVQGAAGMLLQPAGYLRDVRALCDAHDVFLICDEVATGFGRTGRMFACEHEAVTPDFLCLAKGLTGGYMPLAATLTNERVHDGFLGEFEEFKTFFHGHTYTGNPLACAAALATLDVFARERTIDRLQSKIAVFASALERHIAPLADVVEIRRCGFMCGIELRPRPVADRVGQRVTLAARRRGAIVRPLGDVIVLMPALSIEESELVRLVEITGAAIADATAAAGAPLARAA